MNLAKFVSLLKESALYFALADRLGDPFEGTWTKATLAHLADSGEARGLSPEAKAALRGLVAATRMCTALSCWHANDHESAAMWKLYLSNGEGVAVRSSFNRLVGSFPRHDQEPNALLIYVGLVSYIDYDTEVILLNNAYWPFVHERMSFQHENEVRAVLHDHQGTFAGRPPGYVSFPSGGDYVRLDLTVLVESVFVAPSAPPWFEDLVRSLVERYGFAFPIHRSRLGEDRVYRESP